MKRPYWLVRSAATVPFAWLQGKADDPRVNATFKAMDQATGKRSRDRELSFGARAAGVALRAYYHFDTRTQASKASAELQRHGFDVLKPRLIDPRS